MNPYAIIRPVLYRFDAETMHNCALSGMSAVSRSSILTDVLNRCYAFDDPRLAVELFGIRFANPVGIAAGLDKNGVAVPALLALGFSFVEIGTVTPISQPGNPKPRVFRLPEDRAVINRMGFPGAGVETVSDNLKKQGERVANLGCNIGPNKASVAGGIAAEDCAVVLRRLHDHATYLVVNVSSPNTAGLRNLQGKDALRDLLSSVLSARPATNPKPVLVKIAPDMTDQELDAVLEVALEVGLNGIVATNTTIGRPASLKGAHRTEPGGLSGEPLRLRSLEVVRAISRKTAGKLPIIAAGGISSGAHAIDAIRAGASLVQIYTGFIYRGPSAARQMKREMAAELDRLGGNSLAEIRGSTV